MKVQHGDRDNNAIPFKLSLLSLPLISANVRSSALSRQKWLDNVQKLLPAEIIVSISAADMLRISIPLEAPSAPSAPSAQYCCCCCCCTGTLSTYINWAKYQHSHRSGTSPPPPPLRQLQTLSSKSAIPFFPPSLVLLCVTRARGRRYTNSTGGRDTGEHGMIHCPL